MFAGLARSAGVNARSLGPMTFKGQFLDEIEKLREELRPACLCIASLPPAAATHASFLCKLVRGRFPDLPIIVGLWSARGNVQKASVRLAEAGASRITESFSATLAEVGRLLEISGGGRPWAERPGQTAEASPGRP
jgi:hypothetical protein